MVRPYPHHRCAAARHETHHGHVLRHAMEHVYHECPPGTIHPHLSRCSSIVHGTSLLFLLSHGHIIFFHFSSMSSISSRYLSFRIFPVIGFKVNRSKVIFSSRSLLLVPREQFFFFFFFFQSAALFLCYIFPLFSISFILWKRSTNSRMTRRPEGTHGNWFEMHSVIGELNKTFRIRAQIKSTIDPGGNIRWRITNVFDIIIPTFLIARLAHNGISYM